jgi:hypothetical protein
MKIIVVTANKKRRILVDKSLDGNELEAVYPQTAIEDIEKLYEITMKATSIGKSIKKKDAIKMIEDTFKE